MIAIGSSIFNEPWSLEIPKHVEVYRMNVVMHKWYSRNPFLMGFVSGRSGIINEILSRAYLLLEGQDPSPHTFSWSSAPSCISDGDSLASLR